MSNFGEIIELYTVAYKLYCKHCRDNGNKCVDFEYFDKKKYSRFYKEAELVLRNKKINKILEKWTSE